MAAHNSADIATPVAAEQKRVQQKTWSAAAAGWDRRFDWYVSQFQPVFEWCAEAVRIRPGMHVLDVACGAGEPALAIAPRVDPGRVTAVDFAPEMVAAAARRAHSLGVMNVDFHEMDAESLALPDASFDAVTFVCGLMFCPEPERALSEIGRVLKPGGRLALVVWDEQEKNQFAGVAGRAAMAVLNAAPPPPDAPQAFRFRGDDVERLLGAAGFRDISVATCPLLFHYGSVEEYLSITLDLAGALSAKLQTRPAAEQDRFRALVHENATPFLTSDGLRLPAVPLCVSAVWS